MFYLNTSSTISNYADDNNICNSNACLDSLKSNLAQDIGTVIGWYNDNDLDANPAKFQGVVMDRRGMINASIPVGDITLKCQDKIKVLGVTLDSQLNFKEHIDNLCNRASRQINALRRISKFLDTSARLKIFKSYIHSNFSYCPIAWIFCGKVNSVKLEKLQERALRFVFRDFESTYDELLTRANILPLSLFRLRFLAIEIYKCRTDNNPLYLNELFKPKSTTYNLRDSKILHQPRFNTFTFGYRSFNYYGAKLWNSLPVYLKNAESVNNFKILLDQ